MNEDETTDLPEADDRVEGEGEGASFETDDEVIQLVRTCAKQSDKHLSNWMEEAKSNYDMVAGHQWDDTDKAGCEEQNRQAVVFNRIVQSLIPSAAPRYRIASRCSFCLARWVHQVSMSC